VDFVRKELLGLLADPVSKSPLTIEAAQEEVGDVLEGTLRSSSGAYPVRKAIPRFVLTEDARQKQTENSFGYKWSQVGSYDSPGMHETSRKWLVKRYGFEDILEMQKFFSKSRLILDAGCGSGFSASLWMDRDWRRSGHAEWVGADISSAIDVARDRLAAIPGTSFVQADLMRLPFKEKTFDTIFSEGVLHHTPSTEKAFRSLVNMLAPGGEILFYVYRKKGPIREFTDDYVRHLLSPLDPEEAWEKLKPLTRLGESLASLHAEVQVKEDVPDLGIKAGAYDIQRFIYWNFAKLFWNDAFSFEGNVHVNFDWYHPAYAHRHTEEEIRRWCEEARLTIRHWDAQESGFTVRAKVT
jgi:arsenite methyltransferase